MNPLAYLQFFVQKRHSFLHWIYRRMYRAYGWFLVAIDPKLTMDQFIFGSLAFWFSVCFIIFSLITLMIP